MRCEYQISSYSSVYQTAAQIQGFKIHSVAHQKVWLFILVGRVVAIVGLKKVGHKNPYYTKLVVGS